MKRTKEKSEPIILVASNRSSVQSGEVELFDLQNVDIKDNTRGKTEVLTEKYHNESSVEVKQTTEYGGNPYVEFDMGDEGESFVVGKEVVIKVNGQPKRGIVQEFDDGQGGTIKGFGNPYLFNSSLYPDNGLDYFAFYESGAVIGNYISGHINDGASTFTFKLNNSNVSADVDENGDWIYEIQEGETITSLRSAFDSKTNLVSVDLSQIDVSTVTDMGNMFRNCTSLTTLNLSGWNTANVTNMGGMFNNCSSLNDYDFSRLRVDSVTSMANMFGGCSSLTTLNLSGWNTANVTSVAVMFQSCTSLTTLNLSGWNTASITNMANMFTSCSSLTTLDLSGWNTASVTNMQGMFYFCTSLTTLNLSGWNTANVTNMEEMFYAIGTNDLDLSSFNTLLVTNYYRMFSQTSKVVKYKQSLWNPDIITAFPDVTWNNVE